jgi:hypothetical protein
MLVVETSLYYDARSEKHQINHIDLIVIMVLDKV